MDSRLTLTTRGSEVEENPPNANQVRQAVEVCNNSPELMDYLVKGLSERLQSLGLLEDANELLTFVRSVRDQLEGLEAVRPGMTGAWAGNSNCLLTDFQNLHINRAEKAQAILTSALEGSLTQEFALQAAQFLRGYSADGAPLDAELLAACDDLFNAWLAENNIISQGGQLYEATDNGAMIRSDGKTGVPDNINAAKKADEARIRRLLTDPDKGFKSYLAKKGVQLISRELLNPEQKGAAKTPAEVRKAAVTSAALKKPKQQRAAEPVKPAAEGPDEGISKPSGGAS